MHKGDMKNVLPKLLCCAALTIFAAFPSNLNAALLVTYDFASEDGDQAVTAVDTTLTNISASGISRGAAYTTVIGAAFADEGMGVKAGETTSDFLTAGYSFQDAVDGNGYFELTVTADLGFSMSIDSIDLAVRRASNKTGPNFLGVRSSLDSYTADLVSGVSNTGTQADPTDQNLDFGSLLQNITGSVTLRFYGYGRNNTNTSYGLWVVSNSSVGDEFAVNGTVSPVPEPSVTFLLGFAVLGFVVLRKRRVSRQPERIRVIGGFPNGP